MFILFNMRTSNLSFNFFERTLVLVQRLKNFDRTYSSILDDLVLHISRLQILKSSNKVLRLVHFQTRLGFTYLWINQNRRFYSYQHCTIDKKVVFKTCSKSNNYIFNAPIPLPRHIQPHHLLFKKRILGFYFSN